MTLWIAYERDETGWPTDAFLIVAAATQDEARRTMADAITARRDAEQSLTPRARLSEIFIEAPTKLAADDPRVASSASVSQPTFRGFDGTTAPVQKAPASYRRR